MDVGRRLRFQYEIWRVEECTKTILQKFRTYEEERNLYKHATSSYEDSTLLTKILIHISFWILQFLACVNETLFSWTKIKEKHRHGYLPLHDKMFSYYLRYIVHRVVDCWSYPICSAPGGVVELRNRTRNGLGQPFYYTGSTTKCTNLASYNYLGFAETTGPCADAAVKSIYTYGISTGSTRQKNGTCPIHNELEDLVAEFLGVEDAVVFGMGFATNTLNIPFILNEECLVLSDEKNHNSLILGIKLSGARTKVFKHNDTDHLEQLLQEAIYFGQPDQDGDFKQWKKIFVFVEGIYSMDGTICSLPEIIRLKKKYKAYLYLDEAHSSGAMGKTGRGIVEYFGCSPKDIDIWMGTFTKSFGSTGGFIAGSRKFITYVRDHSYASRHAWAMSPPLAAQAIVSTRIIMGKDGTDEGQRRLKKLARNTRYFRKRVEQMGLVVHGNQDSPVVPILVYFWCKIAILTRTLMKENIAIIGVGYPATRLTEMRVRICLSSAHTKEQLDHALEVLEKMADELGLRYSRKAIDYTPIDYHKIITHHDL